MIGGGDIGKRFDKLDWILFGYSIAIAFSLAVAITYYAGYNPSTGEFKAVVHSIFPYECHIEVVIITIALIVSLVGYVLYIKEYLRG